jgi:hypothetical protein
MAWYPPHPPTGSVQSIVAYWQAILAIPLSEPGAEMLRDMASRRLTELHIAVTDVPTETGELKAHSA